MDRSDERCSSRRDSATNRLLKLVARLGEGDGDKEIRAPKHARVGRECCCPTVARIAKDDFDPTVGGERTTSAVAAGGRLEADRE
jgi:hypothetical protein